MKPVVGLGWLFVTANAIDLLWGHHRQGRRLVASTVVAMVLALVAVSAGAGVTTTDPDQCIVDARPGRLVDATAATKRVAPTPASSGKNANNIRPQPRRRPSRQRRALPHRDVPIAL